METITNTNHRLLSSLGMDSKLAGLYIGVEVPLQQAGCPKDLMECSLAVSCIPHHSLCGCKSEMPRKVLWQIG